MISRLSALLGATLLVGFVLIGLAPGATAATVISVTVFTDSTGNAAQCSLRSAVAAANAHGTVDGCIGAAGAQTINLPAGTYTVTGGLSITEPVTITGANAGVDGRSSSRGAGAIINFTASATNTVLFALTGAGGASTFDGLDLRGQLDPANVDNEVNAIIFQGGPPDASFTLQNSTVGGFTWALYISGVGETVKNNDFIGELAGVANPGSIGAYGNAMYGDFPAANVTVQDNRFAGYSNAAVLYDTTPAVPALTNLVIQRNTVLDDGALGFLAGKVNGATITNNWITANPTPGQGGVRGIVIADGSSHITITQNTIDNQNTDPAPASGNLASAIRVKNYDPTSAANSTVTITANRIAGNSTAFYIDAGTLADTINATSNWWGANAGIGGLGGSGQRANGINTTAGTAAGINATSPLQLAVDCTSPSGYVIGTAGPFTATVANMPTWYTAAAHYASGWPRAGDPGDPLFTAAASSATVSGFTAIATGTGAEAYGGTVSGALTPTALVGSISIGVDEELIGCAWTASDAPALAATGPSGRGPTIHRQLTGAVATIAAGALLLAFAGRRRLSRRPGHF